MKDGLPPSALQLLALSRASLWQTVVDENVFTADSTDWRGIGRLALQQTVGALSFEAALSLPESLLPPKEWRQRAFAFIEANRRTSLLVDRCVVEATSKLRDEGIGSVLLKGQAYARAYPRPEMRQCGDIDLYVGEGSYHGAYKTVKRLGWKSEEEFSAVAKHYGCSLHGVRIELHRVAAQPASRSVDSKFREWSRIQIAMSIRTIAIADGTIHVPTALFDMVFVFMHLYHHFLNGGIGLRHLCDWTMLMHLHAKTINLSDLEQKLREFGLMRGWKTFAPIAVHHLGLPESECPFYSGKYRKLSERVLSIILKEGNFGRAREEGSRPKGYFRGKLYALRHTTSNQMRKLPIDPKRVTRSFVKTVFIGSVHTLGDIMKGRWR